MKELSNTVVKTMTSLEIANLTGKEHKYVMRDIRAICEQMQGANLSFLIKSITYTGSNGLQYSCYELDYDATMLVVTGYNVIERAKVIAKLRELENQLIDPKMLEFKRKVEIHNSIKERKEGLPALKEHLYEELRTYIDNGAIILEEQLNLELYNSDKEIQKEMKEIFNLGDGKGTLPPVLSLEHNPRYLNAVRIVNEIVRKVKEPIQIENDTNSSV